MVRRRHHDAVDFLVVEDTPEVLCTCGTFPEALFDDPGAPDEGWRLKDPSTLELVGAACTTLKTTPNATLSASFPCGAILPLPK